MDIKNEKFAANIFDGVTLDWLECLTIITRHIGGSDFEQAVFDFLYEHLLIDHFAVFTYSEKAGAAHLFTKSIMPSEEAAELAKDYVSEYHQRDPHFKRSNEDSVSKHAVHPSLNDEYDSEYLNHFFIQHDLVDKLSIIRKVNKHYIYCNFYRIGDSGKFTQAERELFDSILPLLAELIACHFKILHLQDGDDDDAPSVRSLVHSVISTKVEPFNKLTTRESEVCERILVGFTSTGISLDLGIAESSVNTYRRRAYEKLGIATQNELFSMCISSLSKSKHRSRQA
jgi:DNA-binding CsgD family transcriptional regulator